VGAIAVTNVSTGKRVMALDTATIHFSAMPDDVIETLVAGAATGLRRVRRLCLSYLCCRPYLLCACLLCALVVRTCYAQARRVHAQMHGDAARTIASAQTR
jgi:hypothetical protein